MEKPFLLPAAQGLYGELAEVTRGPEARRRLWIWCVLAILALGLAGVFALLLALSRIPGSEEAFPWPVDFFQKGLIIHVIFSFVVWFLAVFAALLELGTLRLSAGRPGGDMLGKLAWMGTAAAFPLLFVPALMDRGEPSLNNYVPTIIDPVYYAGLAALALGIGFAVMRYLLALARRARPVDPFTLALAVAGLAYLTALVCIGLALSGLEGETPSHDFNEELFWGGGHVLQFVNTTMLAVGWAVLTAMALGGQGGVVRGFVPAVVVIGLSVLPTPLIYALFEPYSEGQRLTFTNLQYLHAPSTLLVAWGFVMAVRTWRGTGSRLPWSDPAFLCAALSVGVFGIGGILGLFVDGLDTRTPGHYHGVIAGINVALMGLFYMFLLPLQGRPARKSKVVPVQVYLFALGQAFASLGLFLAGGHGTPRKTAGAAQGLEDAGIGATVGMAMNGLGGLIAVIGGIMFFLTVARALMRPAQDQVAVGTIE